MENNLFIKKRFKMHAGGMSDFKLECDALTEKDYDTLAFLISRKISFKKAYGVPSGGLIFAEKLNQYKDENSNNILIAEDVVTTGKSMEDFKQKLIKEDASLTNANIFGITAFSRGPLPFWVRSVFNLDSLFWQND